MERQQTTLARADAVEAGMIAAPPAMGDTATISFTPASVRGRTLNVLMVCGLFTLPYRAVRCAAAAGATVHVLGNKGARGFRYSRFCASFSPLRRNLDATFDAGLADEINAAIDRLDIDIVMAGDQPATRSLVGVRPLLRANCFPMPDLATLDMLSDKWEFFKLCTRLGVPCPASVLLADAAEVARQVGAGLLRLPLIAKPLSLDAARGVVKLAQGDFADGLATIRYNPVMVQAFIPGVDIGASAYCEDGEIRAFILHRLADGLYSAFADRTILQSIQRIIRATGYSGVCNFDMRLDPGGQVYFLECNARFFYKMDMSLLAGVNFVAHGLHPDMAPQFVHGANVRLPKAALATLGAPWAMVARDFDMLGYRLSDPVSYVRQCLRIDWEGLSY